ncbi:hypothetical protein D187_004478 [Cystobacter fuscus DSM 2262]|uniref:Uncharacterized protein n=1 Tax=Cystobacter fuscus (strain ATCC 25194 / DSM 2262 / NBRC 100088 / M29) TaxID=1242864 RepID=S9Q9B8_CYSF2|nr:hypothetical protein [Cystobacter fuscus]EPX57944.1 hypothetical protein D187_004478 [Cystobacter fuscus DSM 2262]
MTAWLAMTLARISHSHSQSMKRTRSGGLVLALTGLLLGCGSSLPGEDLEPDGLARSSDALVEMCPAIPLAAGEQSALLPSYCYYCGDGMCQGGESQYSCPDDCGYPSYCGDGVCSAAAGESDLNCATDCYCGDNLCNGSESVNTCPRDCGCPNLCGNGVCNNNETTGTCWTDCGTLCGDRVCNGGENASNCAQDCGYCGDGMCAGSETLSNCYTDCGFCGDGLCRSPETRYNCPDDCGTVYCLSGSDSGNSMLPACPMEPVR